MSVKDVVVDLVVRYGFQVAGAIVILILGILLARWIGAVTQRWLEPRVKEPPVRSLIVRGVRILVLILVLMLALDKFGVQIAPLVAGLGVAGVGVGLAFQGVLGNIVAGLSIIFTKPFRVGEYVELLGVQGQVSTIELFSTTLLHPDQSRVVIPNRRIVGEILHNFGAVRQLQLKVDVAYATNLEKALATAREIVEQSPEVLKEPAPIIGVSSLGASGVTLAIQPWVAVTDFVAAQARLYQRIIERFQATKIDIPFPQCEIRLLNEKKLEAVAARN
ncbi:MAG TPA: mechanosensitive ion channel family protein [Candidatus Acidoferrales bacterium]|nr:mechanosensitive ion channel family protein [Candidatus Acidoferrales bacterium]